MCKSKSSGGHLFHEKVMSQELYGCWKTITTGMCMLLRDSNKVILLCPIEVRAPSSEITNSLMFFLLVCIWLQVTKLLKNKHMNNPVLLLIAEVLLISFGYIQVINLSTCWNTSLNWLLNWESGRRSYDLLVLQYFIFHKLDLNEAAIVRNT